MTNKTTFNLFFLFWYLKYASCLRDLILSLPPTVIYNQSVILTCSYHLQGEELYSVKLLKGFQEFLQYVPGRKTPLKIFSRKGIGIQNVTLIGVGNIVTGISVLLSKVDLFSTGFYSCEASADKSFHTELEKKWMTVLVEPKERPEVNGYKPLYKIGDILNISCILKETFPAANLTWFINGKKIMESESKIIVRTSKETGYYTSESHLFLRLKSEDFNHGDLRGKCLASLYNHYWQSLDVRILEETPQMASVLENSSNKSHMSNGNVFQIQRVDPFTSCLTLIYIVYLKRI